MLDKKQIRVIFLFKFKMGCKAAETICNNNAFGPKTANQCTGCRGGSRSFAKETRALKMRRVVAGHQKLTTTSWKQSLEADPLTTTQEAAEELNVDHSTVIRHLKQIGKVKKLGKWVPQELTKKKKIIILKYCLLLIYTTIHHYSIRLWCGTKCGFYITTSDCFIYIYIFTLYMYYLFYIYIYICFI